MAKKRTVAYIPGDAYSEENKGFRVSIVKEGETGHFPTGDTPEGGMTAPWYWGPTYSDAKRVADRYNAERGISKEDALDIVGGSMALSFKR